MRTFRVIVSGNEYEVSIEEITAVAKASGPKAASGPAMPTLAAAPQPAAPAQKPQNAPPVAAEGTIVAAMPGTIIDIRVNQGDTVKRGDTLLILEAMKMENEIKAPVDGVVSVIEVSKGAAVNAGTRLLVLS